MSEVHRFVADRSPDVGTGENTDADTDAGTLSLVTRLGLREVEVTDLDRRFFDTPDGRLHGMGTTLEVRTPVEYPMMRSLVWLHGGQVLASARVDAAFEPGLADTLPPGAGFDRLRDTIEMRRLLPVAMVRSRLALAAALDTEEKTTARVVIDLPALRDGRPLPALIEIRAIRGYEDATARLVRRIAGTAGVDPTDLTTPDLARAAGGGRPFVPSRLTVQLDRGADAATVWTEVFRALHESMLVNFTGTLDDVDSEYLHDFRVAVRRTRSVLAEGGGVLDGRARDHFRAGFKWLGDITTPTRDADVHLLDYPKMLAALSEDAATALAPLGEFLIAHQRTCQQQLARELRGPRRAQLAAEWAEYLEGSGPWAERPAGPDAGRSARRVVAARVEKAHRRLRRDGRAIGATSPPVALHDLRKDAKRLRYLLECFGPLFPAEDLATAVRPLKALQEVLGEFQDTEVQAGALARFGRRLDEEGADTDTILAMGGAIEQLSVRSSRARRAYADRFAEFDTGAVRRAYERLTTTRKGGR
ncbi:MAG: CHAD domain-containing protein [Acidobacteria bacterium]|nr:CHAD domain-containing protein [Acidobacteriota bacterium]